MNDFNYDVRTVTLYTFDEAVLNGKTVQDDTPTPNNKAPISNVEPMAGKWILMKSGDEMRWIDMQGNVISSSPNGIKDVLTISNDGHCILNKNTAIVKMNEMAWTKDDSTYIYYTVLPNGRKGDNTMKPICELYESQNSTQNIDSARTQLANLSCCMPYGTGTNAYIYIRNDDIANLVTWNAALTDALILYPTNETVRIDLGYIDVSKLANLREPLEIKFYATLDPSQTYNYTTSEINEVDNRYSDYDAETRAYKPWHFGQKWETFDPNDWNKAEMTAYTGQYESHAVYTIELCELMESGAFNWSRPEIDWKEAAYNNEQYKRFCKYFEQRFMFREISILPPLQWFTALKRMMVYELMPKYRPLYLQVEHGISPLGQNEYYKERHISSAYPETVLSGNSDYISSGEDKELERIKIDDIAEALQSYKNGYRDVDTAIGDELEVLFISMYTSYVNGL